MSTLLQDVGFALRSFAKRPGFTAVAVLSLALGIGANTAIFSVIDAVLLRPLPYTSPDRLVRLYETAPGGYGAVAPGDFRDWREQGQASIQLAAYTHGSVNLQGVANPERLAAESVTANLFQLLGARPAFGRGFAAGEDQPNAPRVAVLSNAFWRRRFGGDPGIVGKAITLDGNPYTVVGVMPERFRFPAQANTDIWIPMQLRPEDASQRSLRWLAVVGRLQPGVPLATAQARMRAIAARVAEQFPDQQKERGAVMVPLRQDITGDVRPALLVLLGAAAFVLLIACANVANLLLARAADRAREVAIRLALGAGRGRLIRQFLTESALLALAGAAAGVLLAFAVTRALVGIAGPALPLGNDVGWDLTVFAFLLASAIITVLVFGLVPAFQATRVDLQHHLKEGAGRGSAGPRRLRLRSSLVVAEVALALVLLAGAGLMMRALLQLRSADTGMVTRNVLTMHMAVASQKYDRTVSTRFFLPVLQRIRALPGVRAAGLIDLVPLQQSHDLARLTIEGRPADRSGEEPIVESRLVSPGYFRALGIPLVRGRAFSEQDAGKPEPLVLINHALARKYFPHSDPVGHRLLTTDSRWARIVGVVGDVRESRLDQPPSPTLYFSYLQWPPSQVALVISTWVPPTSLTSAVRAAIHSVDPNEPVYDVTTMDRVVAASLSDRRFLFALLGIFATTALALAAAGIYGVMSYTVTQRTREIGIRLALGAEHDGVLRLMVRRGVTLAAAGLAIGTVIALALTRVLESSLYDVSATDPATFVDVILLLGIVALVASYVPARRAAAVDPVIALRD